MYGLKSLFSSKNIKNSGSSTENTKPKDQVLINAFQDIFQIRPDIFKKLVLEYLVLNTPIWNKEKGIPKKKILLGKYRLGWGW